MGRLSRTKGRRGEQEVARRYRARGIGCARTSRGVAQTGVGDLDLETVPGIHNEIKCAGVLRILDWLKQTAHEAPANCVPALHFRQSSRTRSTDWFVAVPLDDWIDLLKEARGL